MFNSSPHGRELPFDRFRDVVRFVRTACPATHLANHRGDVREPTMSVREHRDCGPPDLRLLIHLAPVQNDQVRPEREHPLHVGIEQRAHAWQRSGGGGVVEATDRDDLWACTDREQDFGDSWNDRYDPLWDGGRLRA